MLYVCHRCCKVWSVCRSRFASSNPNGANWMKEQRLPSEQDQLSDEQGKVASNVPMSNRNPDSCEIAEGSAS